MPKFREITGQFVGYIPDSIDSDIVPDRAPMNGRVTFTPVFTGGVIAFPELVPPEFAHPRTIPAKIVDGSVRVEVNEGTGDDVEAVLQPLSLMVTVDDEASQVWSWRAEFDEILIGASDEYVNIPAWSFRVPDGTGPVDLTELVPLKTSATVDVTKGPRGAGLQTITAQNGELVFEYTDGEQATIPVPEAVQGPEGPQGPAGADGAEGPQGEKGDPGEIPDLLVGNITDATPTGKNLMLAATEGAARNALGLASGATAANGSLTELQDGSNSTPRVWTANNLASYVNSKTENLPTLDVATEDHNGLMASSDKRQIRELAETSPQVVDAEEDWRLAETDESGKISRAVDSQGRTWLTPHPDSPGIVDPEIAPQFQQADAPEYAWAVTDEYGRVALGVKSDGTVAGVDSSTSQPYDVVLLVGQSNMRGQGVPYLDREYPPGVDQFPADLSGIIRASEPLSNPDSNATLPWTSLAYSFAKKYRQENPNRRLLLVPAARGATAFSSTTGGHWDWEVTTGTPLAPMAVAQTLAALEAAGPSARFAGILWHQGEGDLSISGQYAEKLDGLMNYFRTELDAPDAPVVVGQMSLDRSLVPDRVAVDAVHQQTPARLVRSAFAPSPLGLHNPGDETHFSTRGLEIIGERFYDGLKRAAFNVPGSAPIGPENVRAERIGDTVRVSWEPSWSRVTSYVIESRVGSGSWTNAGVTHPNSVGLSATIAGPWATEVRVISVNDDGQSRAVIAPVSGAPVMRDTGLRNIASLVITANGWTGTPAVTVMRCDAGVMFSLSAVTRTEAGTGWVDVLQLPTGFQPPENIYSRDFAGGRWRIVSDGKVQVQNPGTALNYFSLAYLTTQAWPTTYPGVAA